MVVVGIDGVRFDTLASARTPRLDALAAKGFLRPVQVNPDGATMSGPSWTTMVTGVLPPVHNVFDNDFTRHRIAEYPDVLTRVRAHGLATYAAAGWPPLVSAASGGPVFLGGGLLPNDDPGHDLAAWDTTDDTITADACRVLAGPDCPAAAFIYLGAPDVNAHELGVGPAYVTSIERSDLRLGRILDTIEARGSYAEEEWTVIVATDHGHLDEGGHGGDSPEERTAWIAAAGASLPPVPPATLEQADVAAHTLTALGIAIAPAVGGGHDGRSPQGPDPTQWRLYGVPFGARD